MIFFGMTSFVVGLIGLWTTRRKFWLTRSRKTDDDEPPMLMLTNKVEMNAFFTKWSWRVGILTMAFPLVANSFGWIFTEMGRQPWVVYQLMRTSEADSPNVTTGTVIRSMTAFTALYAVLAVIWLKLMAKYAMAGPDSGEQPPTQDPTLRGPSAGDADQPLAHAY